jgi:hypothetical protein
MAVATAITAARGDNFRVRATLVIVAALRICAAVHFALF